MHFGTNNNKVKYTMNGAELAETTSERDLGVIFSSDLKWKNHITERESKANAMLGMIKKTFASLNCKLLKTLYTTYVRPLVEFAVPVWNPYLKGEIEALKKIQHRATRLVKNLRKLPLNMTTLSARRNRGDLIQMFKTLNGYEKIDLIAQTRAPQCVKRA